MLQSDWTAISTKTCCLSPSLVPRPFHLCGNPTQMKMPGYEATGRGGCLVSRSHAYFYTTPFPLKNGAVWYRIGCSFTRIRWNSIRIRSVSDNFVSDSFVSDNMWIQYFKAEPLYPSNTFRFLRVNSKNELQPGNLDNVTIVARNFQVNPSVSRVVSITNGVV